MKGVSSYVTLAQILNGMVNDSRAVTLAVDHRPDGPGCRVVNWFSQGGRWIELVVTDIGQELQIHYLKDWEKRCVYANDIQLSVERCLGYLFELYDTVEVENAIEIHHG